MAQRKRLQTKTTDVSQSETRRNDPALPANQFNTIVRAIKNNHRKTAEAVRTAARARLDYLGVGRHGKPVKGTPDGSDNMSIGSVVTWTERIEATDRNAVRQLKSLYATATARLNS